mmetsp:Transcript_94551/g.267634  ORF Transcript_94551/g.267634 Transcript_94551/m.267634 type:complete len:240 (+) Transcript_94551:218-937(+)
MLMTNNICCTSGDILSRAMLITSSSPLPWPVRLSPEWVTPAVCRFPKKTASRTEPSCFSRTAETSRSTPFPRTSHPRPAVTTRRASDCGRSRTVPLSIANATFWRLGAPGMTFRMRLPIVGSRMSMKCCPSCAGSSTTWKSQDPDVDRTMVATTSTCFALLSMRTQPTSFCCLSSRRWIIPFFTSRKCPPVCAATTYMIILTFSGSLESPTHITSSKPSFCPVCSSPECVMHLSAFMLL